MLQVQVPGQVHGQGYHGLQDGELTGFYLLGREAFPPRKKLPVTGLNMVCCYSCVLWLINKSVYLIDFTKHFRTFIFCYFSCGLQKEGGVGRGGRETRWLLPPQILDSG